MMRPAAAGRSGALEAALGRWVWQEDRKIAAPLEPLCGDRAGEALGAPRCVGEGS